MSTQNTAPISSELTFQELLERALDTADVLQNVTEERDELRRDVSALLNALPNGAHDVTEGVVTIRAMRTAIKEAFEEFQFIASNWTTQDLKPNETIRQVFHGEKIHKAQAALTKLQPYAKP